MSKKIQGDETTGHKIWRKTSEIEIWDGNCRNEFTGGKSRDGNIGSEIMGVILLEWDSMEAKCCITYIEDN